MKKRYWFLSILCSLFSAAIVLLAAWLPTRYEVPVLMYHALAPVWHEPLNNVQPGHFEQHMAYLKQHGYKVLALSEFVDEIKSGREHDRKSVVITFDDGYENNYTAAFPVLKKYGFPVTIFAEVGRIGAPRHFTWEEVKEMSRQGVDIQSHLMTGAYLPGVSREQAVYEMTESRRVLEMNLGRPVHFLAYPIGGFSEDVKQMARQAGYQAAFATNRGYDRTAKDLYELKRIRVKDSDGDVQLWLKLSGYYNLIRSSKNPF